jgi:hypothetical protein
MLEREGGSGCGSGTEGECTVVAEDGSRNESEAVL